MGTSQIEKQRRTGLAQCLLCAAIQTHLKCIGKFIHLYHCATNCYISQHCQVADNRLSKGDRTKCNQCWKCQFVCHADTLQILIILLTAGGRLIAGKKKAADTAQNTQQETIEEQTAVLTEVTANIDSDVTEQGKDAVKTASEGSDTSEESDISDESDADMTAGTASADIPFAAGYEFSTTDSTTGCFISSLSL